MLPSLGTSHRVRPLPWPVIELLSATLRKLAHDITNSMVASVSHVDLMALRNPNPVLNEQLQRLRVHVLRPRTVVHCAIASLPALGDRPRTLAKLHATMATLAIQQGVTLHWRVADDPARFDPALTESEWCHVLHTLCQNALEAHAAALIELGTVGQPEIIVDCTEREPRRLAVIDNGPGCGDLAAAASGGLRRVGSGHLGLGLAVIAALIERAGGNLTIAGPAAGGFRATVEMPSR